MSGDTKAKADPSPSAPIAALAGGRRPEALAAAVAELEAALANRAALWVLTEALEDQELALRGRRALLAEAVRTGDLPMVMLTLTSLTKSGHEADSAAALTPFAAGSARYQSAPKPPALLPRGDAPKSTASLLAAAMASISLVETRATSEGEEAATRVTFLSGLDVDALVAFTKCLKVRVVAPGETLVNVDEAGDAAFLVVRGALTVLRREPEGEALQVVAHVGPGALFGELALLSRAPRTATITSASPAILLVAERSALVAAVETCPPLGAALAAHCRERLLAQALLSAPVFTSVHDEERPAFAQNFELRVHDEGEILVHEGDAARGLFVVAAGKVHVAREDEGERLFLDELGPGDIFGELATVLRRPATADVVAIRPTVTLFLPREKFVDLVRERPLVLHALYLLAVGRDDETRAASASSTLVLDGDDLFV